MDTSILVVPSGISNSLLKHMLNTYTNLLSSSMISTCVLFGMITTSLAELESNNENDSRFSDMVSSLIAQFAVNRVLLAVNVYIVGGPQSKSRVALKRRNLHVTYKRLRVELVNVYSLLTHSRVIQCLEFYINVARGTDTSIVPNTKTDV